MGPNITDILFELGVGERVVGPYYPVLPGTIWQFPIIKEKVTFCKYFFLPQVKNPRFPAPAPFAPQNKL